MPDASNIDVKLNFARRFCSAIFETSYVTISKGSTRYWVPAIERVLRRSDTCMAFKNLQKGEQWASRDSKWEQ